MDWRGPVEIDGFPVLTIESAVDKLIVETVIGYFINQEPKIREELTKKYPLGYGDYDPKKYFFEESLKVIRDYKKTIYNRQISIFTRNINTNRNTKFKWIYNIETNSFVTTKVIDHFAVNINKAFSSILVYSLDPNGGRPHDNYYKYLKATKTSEYFKYEFSNNGTDRFYLYVYGPKASEETDNYVLIGIAEKIVWESEIEDNNQIKRRLRTICLLDNKIDIKEEII
jgi:hypothetical protein